MSKVTALYHIVFVTKNREMTIPQPNEEKLYRFIWSVIKSSGSSLLRIGGIANHVHILLNLNPTTALSTLVRDIKSRSSRWIKLSGEFPHFTSWASEYYASTIRFDEKSAVIEYINSQKKHHLGKSLDEEFGEMLRQSGYDYLPGDLR
ncbi:MAG: IS200/IS605 family transposase [Paramuribaculum sp.]|nr:IS200/IS605 family transposase [Paramuribaculum sp.]